MMKMDLMKKHLKKVRLNYSRLLMDKNGKHIKLLSKLLVEELVLL